MNFLITNLCTRLNKGDAGIVLGIIDSLHREFKNPHISVSTFTPKIDRELYKKYNVTVVRNLIGSPRYNDPFKKTKNILLWGIMLLMIYTKLWAVLHLYNITKKILFLNEKDTNIVNEYINADVIISCGGGFLLGGFGSVIHMLNILSGIILHKPVVIYSQSIGPFYYKPLEKFVRYLLNRTTLIFVREEISKKYLQSIGVTKEIYISPDAAFNLPITNSDNISSIFTKYNLTNKKLVGVTVRNWSFPGYKNKKQKLKNYIFSVSRLIDYLISVYNFHIIFIPQVILTKEVMTENIDRLSDDREVAKIVYQNIKNKDKVDIIIEDLSPGEIKKLIGTTEIFIGTRMHSNIFALSMNVPTLAIEYLPKTRGIMRMLDLEKYVCDINNISFDELKEKVNMLLTNQDRIRLLLQQKMEKITLDARTPAKEIKKIINKNITRVNKKSKYFL